MVTTTERRRDARISELLDVALELVGEEGLDGLTIARLSKRMGWTKGAMYRYYTSKDQLVAALNARVLTRWSEQADSALQGDPGPLDRVRILLHTLVRLSAEDPHAFGLVALTMAHPNNLVASIEDAVHIPQMMGLLGRIATDLDAAQRQGVLSAGDPLQRALRLAFAVIGVLQLRKLARFDPHTFDADRLATATIEDLLDAWRTP